MRRIIVSINITLDGFIAEPDGSLDWQFKNWTTDMAEAMAHQLNNADTLLLGRKTYSAMAGYWPAVSNGLSLSRDDIAFADMMNGHAKIVCSTTLKQLKWNNSTLINCNPDAEIRRLKQLPGKDIMVYGSCTLVNYLMQLNLIDEFLLWVYPIVLGHGIPLFKHRRNLKLKTNRQFPSGVVVLCYEPA